MSVHRRVGWVLDFLNHQHYEGGNIFSADGFDTFAANCWVVRPGLWPSRWHRILMANIGENIHEYYPFRFCCFYSVNPRTSIVFLDVSAKNLQMNQLAKDSLPPSKRGAKGKLETLQIEGPLSHYRSWTRFSWWDCPWGEWSLGWQSPWLPWAGSTTGSPWCCGSMLDLLVETSAKPAQVHKTIGTSNGGTKSDMWWQVRCSAYPRISKLRPKHPIRGVLDAAGTFADDTWINSW